jgi:acetyltransferase-like isoleucine patch superfamily enzyme
MDPAIIKLFDRICYFPHADINQGNINLPLSEVGAFNSVISPGCRIDLTGSVSIGHYCMFGAGTQILTHDHYHVGRVPLLLLQKEKGVMWQNKIIGDDVWLHDCTILYQVTNIPDGVVIGAKSVLTKNPGPYEIWAGNPAKKIGER